MTTKQKLSVCPQCGALCREGCDDDFQQNCSNCECNYSIKINSIKIYNVEKIGNDRFLINGKEYIRKIHHGWEAYVRIIK